MKQFIVPEVTFKDHSVSRDH